VESMAQFTLKSPKQKTSIFWTVHAFLRLSISLSKFEDSVSTLMKFERSIDSNQSPPLDVDDDHFI
jgi:hypothetical protein